MRRLCSARAKIRLKRVREVRSANNNKETPTESSQAKRATTKWQLLLPLLSLLLLPLLLLLSLEQPSGASPTAAAAAHRFRNLSASAEFVWWPERGWWCTGEGDSNAHLCNTCGCLYPPRDTPLPAAPAPAPYCCAATGETHFGNKPRWSETFGAAPHEMPCARYVARFVEVQ